MIKLPDYRGEQDGMVNERAGRFTKSDPVSRRRRWPSSCRRLRDSEIGNGSIEVNGS